MGRFSGSTAISVTDIRYQFLIAMGFAVMTAAFAQISFRLWFTPVPITLQVLGVILSGLLLGRKLGAISQIQYLMMGAMGLPVFANFSGGPAAFLGPSGGYLLGFVAGAYAAGWVFERMNSRGSIASWAGGIAGIIGVYLPGSLWLAMWVGVTTRQPVCESLSSAFYLGIVPFIGVDLLKAAVASSIVQRINR